MRLTYPTRMKLNHVLELLLLPTRALYLAEESVQFLTLLLPEWNFYSFFSCSIKIVHVWKNGIKCNKFEQPASSTWLMLMSTSVAYTTTKITSKRLLRIKRRWLDPYHSFVLVDYSNAEEQWQWEGEQDQHVAQTDHGSIGYRRRQMLMIVGSQGVDSAFHEFLVLEWQSWKTSAPWDSRVSDERTRCQRHQK